MKVVLRDQDSPGPHVPGKLPDSASGVEYRLLLLIYRVSKVAMEALEIQTLMTLQPGHEPGLRQEGDLTSI